MIDTVSWDNGALIVNTAFVDLFKANGIVTAEALYTIDSESVKSVVKERGTSRAFLQEGDNRIETYIKRYAPVSLKEKLKLKLFFKPPTATAYDEWKALCLYHEIGLRTMSPMAVAEYRGQTCNLTLGIRDYVRASELFAQFGQGDCERKKTLIESIARYVGTMHKHNLAHQDLYLVHFFVKPDENDAVYLIDLQRTIIQEKLEFRWRVKDLGQLLFSAQDYLSDNEIKLFWDIYTSIAGEELCGDKKLTAAVRAKAERITARDKRKALKKQRR